MAKIPGFAQKIFGSAAGTDQISVFGSLFAGSAATTTNPDTAQSLSNWLTGWFGAAIGGNSPAIEDMNAPFFVMSSQLAYILQQGLAEWNAGTTYYIGSFASNSDGTFYRSLVDNNLNNALSDTTKWKLFSTVPVGTMNPYLGSALPAGYIWASGLTIGSATSGAMERANADCIDLYTLLWENYSNTLLPIQDSGGSLSSRGVSAAADFAANKRLPIIDMRGRVVAGKDNLNNSAAGRLTSNTVAPDGNTLGANGGEQEHTLSSGQMPVHTHTQQSHNHTQNPHTHTYSGNLTGSAFSNYRGASDGASANTGSTTATNNATTAVNDNAGGGEAHINVQPTLVAAYIIKL